MQTTHDFLEALELDAEAQERDIRRAYARKLKRIDQEADPGAFQALRAAYEEALDWARWKLAREAGEAASGAGPATDAESPGAAETSAEAPAEPAPPDAMQLGATVFRRFGTSAEELATTGKLGDPQAWRAALEARFADDELVNIDARIYFEAYVASLLASGWQPGHEALFVAAQEAFAWAGDRRRLWQLGQAGRMLDQAIEERQLFDAQPATERGRMRDLARMLRQDELPSTRRIRAAMPDTERMLGRFPALMAIVASRENVERWRTVYRESGGAPIPVEAADDIPAQPKRSFSALQGTILVIALIAVLRAMFNYAGGEQDAGRGFIPPSLEQTQAPAVPQEVLDRVVPPVRYTPAQRSGAGTLEVIYKVFLNADHEVERVQNWQTSGDPGFDEAVGSALRSARPFPAGTPGEFTVRYVASPKRDPQLPKAGGARTLMPEAPLSEAALRAHLPRIEFTPSRYAKEGRYSGVYRIVLDQDGKVTSTETVKSSGDLRLDRAVRAAFWAGKPFPGGFRSFDFSYSTRIVRKAQPAGDGAAQPPATTTPPTTDIED